MTATRLLIGPQIFACCDIPVLSYNPEAVRPMYARILESTANVEIVFLKKACLLCSVNLG